jgi:uncharacterized protein DUF4145
MTVIPGTGQSIAFGAGYSDPEMRRKQAAFTCDHCHRMSIGEALDSAPVHRREIEPYLEEDPYGTVKWYPERGTAKAFPDVPQHIAEAASEATYCLSLGAYRAVGSLARAVVEAAAKERGITSGTLGSKIDKMYEQHLIREHIKEAAHEVRHFGNDMAHGDFVEAVTEEEATEAVALMEEVLNEVFQSPAKVARARESRLAKKAEGA